MNKFTVIMLYPDYLSDGAETYVAHVEALNQKEACKTARIEAVEVNDPTAVDDPDDFSVLHVFEGHLEDIYEGH